MSQLVAPHNDVISEQSVIYPNVSGRLANLRPIQPGQVLNPNGRPTGSRNRLSQRFTDDLFALWETDGAAALVELRHKDVGKFCQIVSNLIPRQSAHIRANLSQQIGGDVARDALLRAAAAMGLTLTDTHSVPLAPGGIENGVAPLAASSVGGEVQEQPLTNNSVGVPKIPEVLVISGVPSTPACIAPEKV